MPYLLHYDLIYGCSLMRFRHFYLAWPFLALGVNPCVQAQKASPQAAPALAMPALAGASAPSLTPMANPPLAVSADALGYSQILKLLWAQHPQLQAKRSEVRAAELGTVVAARQHWPTPSLSADSGPKYTGTPNTGDSRFFNDTATTEIYTGGLLTAEQEMAALRWQLAELDVAQNTTELSMQLIDSYRQWWQAQSREDMIRRSMRRLQELRVMMERRAQAGVSSDTDVALTQAHLERFKDELSQVERLRTVALNDVALMVGQTVKLRAEPLATLPPWAYSGSEGLRARVVEVHPALRFAEGQHALALKDIDRTKASAFPSLSLRAERQWGAYQGALGPGERVYLNSQVSLGAGLSNLQQQEQAVARAEAAERQISATRQRIESLATRLWHEHEQALVQLRNAQALVASYDDITDSNLRLFASGRRSWLDLLNLLREQHQFRLQLADAQSGVLSARLRMAVLADQLPGMTLGQF